MKAKEREQMLTTVDNPYDPNTDYDHWLEYDHDHGYYTQELLARVAPISESESEQAFDIILDEAMNQIIEADSLGIYKIV
jgi:hypothetical protein